MIVWAILGRLSVYGRSLRRSSAALVMKWLILICSFTDFQGRSFYPWNENLDNSTFLSVWFVSTCCCFFALHVKRPKLFPSPISSHKMRCNIKNSARIVGAWWRQNRVQCLTWIRNGVTHWFSVSVFWPSPVEFRLWTFSLMSYPVVLKLQEVSYFCLSVFLHAVSQWMV